MGGNNKCAWLSVVLILIVFCERVTVADDDYVEPVPSSLYGPNDHITVLNSENFESKVYNKVSIFTIKFQAKVFFFFFWSR